MAQFTALKHADNRFATAGVSIVASSTAAGYSVSSAVTLPVAQVHRFTGDTLESYELDLGSAKSLKGLSINNHNLSSGATITVRAGSSPNPDGSQFETVIDWTSRDAFKILSSTETWRYWKIILEDPSNPDGFIQVGYILGSPETVFAFNFAYGWRRREEFHATRLESEMGVPLITRRFQRFSVDLTFKSLTEAQMASLRAFIVSLGGDATPVLFIPEAGGPGYLGRFVDDFEETVNKYRDVSLRFVEDSRGRSLGA